MPLGIRRNHAVNRFIASALASVANILRARNHCNCCYLYPGAQFLPVSANQRAGAGHYRCQLLGTIHG